MIPAEEITMRPTLSFLSREDKEKIDRAAFKILSDIGMKILHDEALELLKNAGCRVEMSQYYDLPNWGYAGTSDAQIPDEQAVFEAGLLTFLSAVSGSNLNHDLGYLDFGRTGSLDLVVMLNELIDQVRRLCRGIPVNDDTLAVNVTREVGANGNFLIHEHTLKHLRSTQWRPELISRMGYEAWRESGSTSFLQRARTKLQQILQEHQPHPIPVEQARKIQERVDRFK